MKKRKPLKSSFVVTFAANAVALSALGCNGYVTTNPPMADCPETEPANGAACEEEAEHLLCTYGVECDYHAEATCEGGEWVVNVSQEYCNPPLVECPEELPENGTTCDGDVVCQYETCPFGGNQASCNGGYWYLEVYGSCDPPPVVCPDTVPTNESACSGWGTCTYYDECGVEITASCNDVIWTVQYDGTCNPPAPCEYIGDQAFCEQDPSCVWHTPGCGDDVIPSLPQAGCFTATPCDVQACQVGTCQQVMVTPDCVAEGCDACGQAVMLCIP